MDILYVSCIRVKNAMKERSAASMNKKKITVCIGVISVGIIVVIAALFLTLTKKTNGFCFRQIICVHKSRCFRNGSTGSRSFRI